jgi:hypothetical protein
VIRVRWFNSQSRAGLIKHSIVGAVAAVLMSACLYSEATPVLNNVAAGNVSIQQSPNTTVIQQSSSSAIINWQQFNIGQNQAVHFQQPAGGVTLNRVSPALGASQIYGTLTATGRIILINPAGIYFSPTSYVNVGSIIASTANITDQNFLQGNFQFSAVPGYSGAVINDGTIRAISHGLVALVGGAVENNGTIQANLGNVVLASGTAFTFSFAGNDLINFNITGATTTQAVDQNGHPISVGVSNKGRIIANGGTVRVSADAAENVLDEAINMSGIVQANSVAAQNGAIIFSSGGSGRVVVTGKLLASGKKHHQHGGTVTIQGQQIDFNGLVDTSGSAGGGNIIIGNNSSNTDSLIFGPNAVANASAITRGNAGSVTLLSNNNTQFSGSIFARGGAESGNGGQVETSGGVLTFTGSVDTTAPHGSLGSLLLDPEFLIIETTGGSSYNAGTNNLFGNNASGTSIITPASLNSAAANITLQANSDVIFVNALNMTTSGDTLTVQAGRSILVNSNITTTNGAISLTANDSASTAADRQITSTNNPSGVGDNETVNGNITLGAGDIINSGTTTTTLTIGSSTTAPYTPGSITQGATGGITAGNVIFVVPTASSGSIGTAGNPMLTTSTGSLTLTSGSGGAFIANTGNVTLATPTLATNNPLFVTSSGTLTLPASAIATGTGNLTLESLGAGAALTTAGSLTTTNGNLTLSSAGILTIANALQTGSGTINLTSTGASVAQSSGGTLTSTSGNLMLNAFTSIGLAAAISEGSGLVTIDANTGGTGTNNFVMNTGSSITDTNTSTNAVAIDVNTAGGGSGAATLGNITTGNGGTITVITNTGSNTTGGAITQTASTLLNSGTSGAVSLATGAVAAGIGTSGATILTDTASINASTGTAGFYVNDTTALTLGAITTTGALTVTAGGSISQTGILSATNTATFGVTAASADILLNTQSNSLGTLALAGTTADIRNLAFKSTSASALLPSLAALTNLNNLTVNFTNASIAALSAITTTGAGSINITTSGSITTAGNLTTAGGNLALTAGTGLTLANAISTGAGTVALNANNAGTGANNFSMSGTTGTITTTNTGASAVVIDVNNTAGGTGTATLGNITTGTGGTITVATNLGSNTTGGSISQTAATLLNSGASGTVSLTTGGSATGIGASGASMLVNSGTISAKTGTTGIYLNNSQTTILGAVTTTGAFALTSGGSITQSGALSVGGTSNYTVTAASSDLLLSNTGNSFGSFTLTGITANFRDVNIYNTSASAALPSTLLPLTNLRNVTFDFSNAAIVLPEETLYNSGNLAVTANGAITQAGQQSVPGTTTINAGAHAITLTIANNIFTGAVALTNSGTSNVALTDNSPLVFGNVAVGSGALNIISTQTITQAVSTSITEAAGSGIAAFTSLGGLTLTNSGNALTGFSDTNLVGGNIQLVNTIANLAVTGITAAGGGNISISNTGNLTTSGAIANTPNGTITLSATGTETIGSPITSNGSGFVNLTGNTAIDLGANITTSGGNITFNSPVMLTGATTLNSSIGNIMFDSTLDGAYSPVFTSAGTLTFGGVVGGQTPLTGLNITANSPGVTVVAANVSTAGSQTYGNPVTLNGTSTFLATGGNAITITGGVNWGGTYTLALNAQTIAINGAMNGSTGSLTLTAAAPPTASITTGTNGSINVKNFSLLQGFWSQDSSTLPSFAVSNNFSINGGSLPTANAEFFRVAGGSGSSGSPYQITDIYGLQGIESNTSLLTNSYALTAGFTASTANWNGGLGFIPISTGTGVNAFSGTKFDGQNNTITGLTISSAASSEVGLFGIINSGTSIINLGLAGVSITGTASGGASNVGAIVGENNGGTLTNDYSTGTVSTTGNGASNVGGLAGDNLGGITLSYSTANVNASGTSSSDIGGLVGNNAGSGGFVNTSYSSGNVTAGSGSSNIGGLVGEENSTHTNAIQNTYSISGITVTSGTDVGGLVGDEVNGPILTSYSSGVVPASGTNVGGFVGNTSIATNSADYFDSTSSGTGVGATGSLTGITAGCFTGTCSNGGSAVLSSYSLFNGASWNIATGPYAGTTPPSTIWYIISGSTRPMLAMEWSTNVSNPHQLELMNLALGASYSLSNIDISVAGPSGNAADVWGGSANSAGFYPIGNTATPFTGSLSGGTNGATINNLYINSTATTGVGLLGATSAAASITSVSVTNANVTDSGSYIGILVGQNNGTITNGSATGSVTASGNSISDIGGLVGENTGTITASTNTFSFSTVTLGSSGNNVSNIGDLIGQNTGSVTSAYSSGALTVGGTSASNIGGLIGDNQGSVSDAFSSSPITLSGLLASSIGGLVGTNETANGNISIAYSSGTISATNATTTVMSVGGLVGTENSTYATTAPLSNIYSTSAITLSGNGTDIGGLVGSQTAGAIKNAYSLGAATITGTKTNVGGFIGVMGMNITNSNAFYDTTTSGTGTSVGLVGSGSTTGVTQGCFSGTCPHGGSAILSDASTFTGANWDFSTVPVWGIFDGVSYPYFTALTLGVQVTDVDSGNVTPTSTTNSALLTPAQIFHVSNNYDYLFNKSDLTTSPILFYNTSGTVGNALVEPPTGSYVAPITVTISDNTIQVGGSNTGMISTNGFGGLTGGSTNILFTSSTGGLVLGNATNPNVTLQSATNTTVNINGSISSTGTNDVITLNGPVTLNNNGGTITTSGSQTYNGNITETSAATLADTNTGAAITINGSLNATSTLTVNNVDATSAINGAFTGAGGLIKQGAGTLVLANNNGYSGGTTVTNGTLELDSTGSTPTPLGTNTLNFSGGTVVAGSALTGPVSNAYTLNGIAAVSTIGGLSPTAYNLNLSGTGTISSGYILNITNSASTTLSGNLSGAGSVNEVGGTLVLSGTNNSSYAGTTTLSSNGTLQIGTATNALGTGTLVLNSGTIDTTVTSPTTMVLNNPVTVNGTVTVTGTNSLIDFNSTNTQLYGGNLIVTNTGTTTFSGTLVAGAGSLTVNAGAGTVVVSGASNSAYLGATTLTSGTLDINAATNALGTGTGNSLVLNGGLLQSTYTSGTASLVNKFLVGGTGSATVGGINSLTLNGNGELDNTLNVTNTAGTITLNGTLIGTAGEITENGTGGTLVIPGTNTFGTAGATGIIVTAGTLVAENSTALGIGNAVVSSGGELALNGSGSSLTIANPLSLAGTGVSNAGALADIDTNTGDTNTVSSAITLTNNATIGVTPASVVLALTGNTTNAGFTTTFDPAVASNSITESGVNSGLGGINMNGPGKLTLSGTNLFTGNNIVSAGTVVVSNTQGLGVNNATTVDSSSLVEVSGVTLVGTEAFTLNGGTLEGITTTAGAGGAITLAASSADTLSTLASGETFTLSGTINGTSSVNNGDLTLSGAGTIVLGGVVGGTTAIDSLTDGSTLTSLTIGSGTTGAVTSVGNQTYNSAVTISGTSSNTLKTTGTGNISITNTMAAGAHSLTLNTAAGGAISESGSGKITDTGTVTTTSNTGTTLSGANAISTFAATDTSTTGITLANTIALTLNAITESAGGAIAISTSTGNLADSNTIQNTGGTDNITLSATAGTISQTGHINGGLLTTTSKSGTVLGGANTVTSFNATNTNSGNISLTNTAAPLAITGISQTGGGTTTVTNTGAVNVNGTVTGGAGSVTLTATGAALTDNQNITATNQAIVLTGAGISVAASTNVNAGSGNITASVTGAGNTLTLGASSDLLSTGKVTLTADNMTFNTSGTPSQIGGTGASVILQETTAARSIGIAGATGSLQLTAATLADVNATNVHIGNSSAGAIVIGAWTTAANFASNGVLTLDSGSTITQTGALNILTNSNAGLLLRDASSVNLTNASNNLDNIASTNVAGTLQLESNHAVNVASLTDDIGLVNGVTATGGVTVNAESNGITLNASSPVTANTAGYDIVLAGSMFTNNDGSSALVTGGSNNYFQVWSGTPVNDNRGSLAYGFKQYDAFYGTTTPGQATGNGFLYTVAPVITPTLIGSISKTYDGNTSATNLTPSNYQSAGALDSDTVTLNNPTSGTYDTAQAGTGKDVTVTGISMVSETNSSASVYGYQLGSTTASGNIGTITQEALSVAGIIANNKVYDTTTAATLSNDGTLSGVIGSDNVSLNTSSLTALFTTKNVGNGITVNVSGYTLSGTNAADYTLLPASTTANITPAPLAVTGVTANNKVYDTTTAATLNTSSANLTGVLSADNGNVLLNGGVGTFASQNANTGIAVTVNSITLSGSAISNYYFPTLPSGLMANITPLPLNISGTRVYDTTANFSAGQLGLGNVYSGDTVTLGGSATVASQNIGTYSSFATNSLTSSNSNYTVIGGTDSVSITPATLTYTGTANSMTYGNTVPTLAGSLSGFIGSDTQTSATTGTLAFITTATNTSTVVNYNLNGSGLTAANGNYVFVQAAGNSTALTINQRVLNLTGTHVYDTTVNFTPAEIVASNIVNSDTVIVGGSSTVASKNVGTYTSFATNSLTSSNSNYTVLGGTDSLSITPATLTYTGTANSMTYGNSVPTLSGTVTGFVGGENQVSATTGTLAFTTLATSTSNVGNYNISGSGLTANNGNYVFVQAAANSTALTITQRSLNLTGTHIYDATVNVTPAELTASNIVNGDTVTVGGSATVASANVATYNSFVSNSLTASNSNYKVTGGTDSLSITPATLTYNGTSTNMTYGNTVPTLTGTVTGFVGGQNQGTATTGTVAFTTTATNTSNVGSYNNTGSGLTANNGNYVFAQAAGNSTALTINPRSLNLTGTHVYDTTVNFTPTEIVASNIVNGDTVTLGGTTTVASQNVGTYSSFATNSLTSSNSNYTVLGGTIAASITPATLTYTGTANSMTYGNTVPTLSGTVTGFIGSENQTSATTGTLAFITTATNTSNVGSYNINGSGLTAANGNYVFVQAAPNSTALTINQRSLNLTGTHVYDTTANFTPGQIAASNIVNGDTVTVGGSATVTSQNVGMYSSFATNSLTSSNSNYAVTGGTIAGSITPATLTYNGTPTSMPYGNTVPTLSGTVTGFVGSENQTSATTGTLGFTSAATNTSNVGSYDVTGTGLTANNGNYVFVQAAANSSALTINQRPLNLTGTHVYDTSVNFTPTEIVTSNIVNGDTVTLGGAATVASKNVGAYTSFASNSLTSSNSNYTVLGGTIAASITPATLTYTGTANSMTYGNTVPTLSGTVTGFVGSENQSSATTGTLGFITTATNTSNVGSYNINGSGLTADNGNYVLVQAAANTTALTLNQRPLNLTGTHVYDTTVNFTPTEIIASNIVNGDTVTLGGAATVASQNVGAYTSFASNSLTSSNSNYTVLGGTVATSITPATLTYTGTANSMTYGNTVPTLSGTVTGFVGSENQTSATTGTLAFITTATNTSNVGSYNINGSGLTADNGNYVLVQAAANNTALTINQRVLNLTGTHVYDTTVNFTPGQIAASNIVNSDTVTLGGSATVTSQNVGTYTSFASNSLTSSNSNYAVTGGTINASITPATLTYNGTPTSMTYGNTVPALSGTVSGFVGSENQTSATTGSLAFTTAATNTSNVGSYDVTGSGLTANSGNYVFVQATGYSSALTINQRPLNLTGTHVYDTTANFTPGEIIAGNIVNSDTVTLGGSATVTSQNVGTYTSFATNGLTSSNSNYAVTGGTIAASITPATLTYNGTPTSMTYGNTVPTLSGTVTGFVGSENQTSATTGALAFTSAATSTSNVGSYDVTGTGLTSNNGNYVFVQAAGYSTALTVNQRPLNLTGTHVYDTTVNFTPIEIIASNIVNGDTVTLGGAATVASQNVGTYTSFATNGLTSSNSNYAVTGGTTAASITPATLTYNGTPTSMTYGNTVPTLSGTVTGFVGSENAGSATTGALAFATAATNTSNVGSYDVSGTGLTANNGNYVFVQAAGYSTALTINQRSLNLTGTHVYDTTVNFTPAEIIASNIVNGDTVTLGGSATVASQNVGTYTSFATNGLTSSNSNYAVTGGNIATSITPATLTYNGTPTSMTYGNTVPALSGTVTGFVGSENQGSATTGSLAFNTAATNTSNVGSYDVTGSGLTANSGNYVFVQAAGFSTALAVNQRPLNFTGTHVYDATVNFTPAELVASNIVNGDTVTVGGFATVASANVGTYTNFASNSLTSSSSNYTVIGGSLAASITPATLTYNATGNNMVYGTAVPTLSGTVTGFVGGQTLTSATTGTESFTTPATSTSNVGNYAINGGGLNANNGNYVFVQAGGNSNALGITPATLTIGLTGIVSKVYDTTATATLSTNNYTLTGLVGSDMVTVNDPSIGLHDNPNVGTNKLVSVSGLTISGSGASNYQLAATSASANIGSITPATLTANLVGPITKPYDGTTTATLAPSNFSLSGMLGSDSVGLTTPTTGSYNTPNAGINLTVSAPGVGIEGTSASNYQLASSTVSMNTASITPLTLQVSNIFADNKVFDQSTAATLNLQSAILTGVVPGDSVAVNNGNYLANFATSQVGSSIPVASLLSLTGLEAEDYVLIQPTGLTADITAAAGAGSTSAVAEATGSSAYSIILAPAVNAANEETSVFTDPATNAPSASVANANSNGSASCQHIKANPYVQLCGMGAVQISLHDVADGLATNKAANYSKDFQLFQYSKTVDLATH